MRTILNFVAGIALLFAAAVIADAQETPEPSPDAQQSLADYARTLKAKKKPDIMVNEEDAKVLFQEIENILKFASEDSELPRREPVKYKLIGKAEAEKFFADGLRNSDHARKVQHAEMVLKKFGMLPADFRMSKFLAEDIMSDLAGFYDPREKVMYLLNWVDYRKQRPVMAHELTHALQDQNYNLLKWKDPGRTENLEFNTAPENIAIEPEARTAAVEGQAMIVYYDYLVRGTGRRLGTSSDRIDAIRAELTSELESPLKFQNAPQILKDLAMFPYYDGFAFELEVLKKEGTAAAFAGVFDRPPRDTHEILQPEAYLARTRTEPYRLPNITDVLEPAYKVYDSGSIGELDVRLMSTEYGRENDGFAISPQWDGGTYVAVKKPSAANKADADVVPSDLAVLYVSRWKTYSAAKRFAELYKAALLKRTKLLDSAIPQGSECETDSNCRVRYAMRFNTSDGLVVIEIGANDVLMISQGIDNATVADVKHALGRTPQEDTSAHQGELSLRLAITPAVRAMRMSVHERMLQIVGE
ncbi:MAG TPA: hypothetical protein VN577_23935 [Terriglobales bacterium]|nr:hypothetical protein [Terriglobales bacterium]